MSVMYIISGLIVCISPLLPYSSDRLMVFLIGLAAVLVGSALWYLPWHRLPRRFGLIIGIPLSHIMIAIHNMVSMDPYRYSVYFMVVYVWIGLTQKRWTSFKTLPFTIIAYYLPLFLLHYPGSAFSSGVYTFPVLVVISESISWVAHRFTQAQSTLSYWAYHDALSGLPNRRLFKDRLSVSIGHAKRSGHKVAVLFMDLDNFKNINDTLGHAYGDILIRSVTERLKECVREGDTLSRQGGDEFTLLMNDITSSRDVLETVVTIQGGMSDPYTLLGQEWPVTISIGIAMYPEDADDAESLMRHADIAMYKAKETGRNNYQFFRSDMNDIIHRKMALGSALHRAVEREEFVLYYQPLLEIRSDRIVGVEALVRWQSPDFGLVPPAEFIPLAEETGVILAIGEYVLRTACKDLKQWQTTIQPELKVCVNISPIQFKNTDLVQLITSVLHETGLEANYLEVEITETLAMHDVSHVMRTLSALRKIGVQVAIDDFGTGYSSLSYLSRFPINTVKIDKVFIDGLRRNRATASGIFENMHVESPAPSTDKSLVTPLMMPSTDSSLVSAIIAMAKSMNFNVVAEGVEDPSQLDILTELSCHTAQGYLISKPLPKQDFIDFYTAKAEKTEGLASKA